MNKAQKISVTVCFINFLLCLLFQPFDYISLQHGNIPTFAGFYFAFNSHINHTLNTGFLVLELIVVATNTAIAWLLFRTPTAQVTRLKRTNLQQRSVLILVAVNLVGVLLFPPFENFAHISKAALPTFEGFYFVFGNNLNRQIVSTILHIEVTLILVNGGLLWLLFKDKKAEALSANEVKALARRVRESSRT